MMARRCGSTNAYRWNLSSRYNRNRWGGSDVSSLLPIPILTGRLGDSSSSPLQIHVALQRRKQHHGEISALQVDATIPRLQLETHAAKVAHLAHAVAGLSSSLCKDRAYCDGTCSHAGFGGGGE